MRVESQVTTAGVTTSTIYVGSLEEVANSPSGTTTTTYAYAPDGQRIALAVNGTLSYQASDHLGSPAVTLDGSGNLTGSQLYAAYGTSAYSSGSMPGSYGYTGQHSDVATTGLDYYGARYYDPLAAQFTSADIVRDGWSPFGYVAGNPESYTDPSGHMSDYQLEYGGSGAFDAMALDYMASHWGYQLASDGQGGGGAGRSGADGGEFSFRYDGNDYTFDGDTATITHGDGSRTIVNEYDTDLPVDEGEGANNQRTMGHGEPDEGGTLAGPRDPTDNGAGPHDPSGGSPAAPHDPGSGSPGPHDPAGSTLGGGGDGGAPGSGRPDAVGATDGGSVSLYHVSGPSETDDLLKFGDYGLSPNESGKYFTFTEKDAWDFANTPFNRGRRMIISKIDVPDSFLDRGYRFNDPGVAGPSIVFPDEALPDLYDAMGLPDIIGSILVPLLP